MKKTILYGFLYFVFLSSCEKPTHNCDFVMDQQKVRISFYDNSNNPLYHFYERVYAIGGNGNMMGHLNFYEVPFNPTADNISIVFEKQGQTDTLEIKYGRIERFNFDGRDCYYYIDFIYPEITSHTFPKATTIQHQNIHQIKVTL